MAYPSSPATNQSQALNSSLWDGLLWAYLPGYSKQPIVGSDTLSNSSDTTIDSYTEGQGETYPLGKYRIGTTTPLEGTTASTQLVYFKALSAAGGTTSGVFSTAPTTTWTNHTALVLEGGSAAPKIVFGRGGAAGYTADTGISIASGGTPVAYVLGERNGNNVALIANNRTPVTSGGCGAGAVTSTEPVILGSYYDKSTSRSTHCAIFCAALWNRALTTGEKNLIAADPYALFQSNGSGTTTAVSATTALPAFYGSAQVAPVASITVTTAPPAFSGGASMASASATVTATASLPSYSGGATGDISSGTLTLPVLKNNTGTVLANETGATVHVYAVSTGNKVVTKTGQTTNGSGVMTVTDASIVGGTQYRVVVVLGSGAEGLDKVTAS